MNDRLICPYCDTLVVEVFYDHGEIRQIQCESCGNWFLGTMYIHPVFSSQKICRYERVNRIEGGRLEDGFCREDGRACPVRSCEDWQRSSELGNTVLEAESG